MQVSDRMMIDKAITDTMFKHKDDNNANYAIENVLFSMYKYIMKGDATGFTSEINKNNIKSIHPEILKEMMVLSVLEGVSYKICNRLVEVPDEINYEINENMDANDFRFSMYNMYNISGIVAVDEWLDQHVFSSKSSEDIEKDFSQNKAYKNLGHEFIKDRYKSRKIPMGALDSFMMNTEVGKDIYDRVTGYYNDKISLAKGQISFK